MKKVINKSLVFLAATVLAGNASAGVIAYTDRNAWEAAVGGVFYTEDFSSTPSGVYEFTPIDVGDFTVSVNGSTFGSSWHNISATGAGGASANSVNGTQQLNVATGSVGGTVLDFDFDIYAFGANFASVSDSRTTSFMIDGFQLDIPYLTGGFFGFVSDSAFSSNVLALTAGGADGFGMDNLVYAAASTSVPVPASFALLGLGLAGLGFARKKTKA